jgi:hypothetical protein
MTRGARAVAGLRTVEFRTGTGVVALGVVRDRPGLALTFTPQADNPTQKVNTHFYPLSQLGHFLRPLPSTEFTTSDFKTSITDSGAQGVDFFI